MNKIKRLTVITVFTLLSMATFSGVANAAGSTDPETWGDDGDSQLTGLEFKDINPYELGLIKQNADQN